MTANTHKLVIALSGVLVSSPALLTLLDLGPMGYHAGGALLMRVAAVLVASAMLATVIAMAGYLYWLHVIAPAPKLPARVPAETLGQLTVA